MDIGCPLVATDYRLSISASSLRVYRKTAKLTRAADAKKGDQFDSHGKPGDATRISPGGHRLPVVVPGKQPQDVQEEAETASAGDAIVSHHQKRGRHAAKGNNDCASRKKARKTEGSVRYISGSKKCTG